MQLLQISHVLTDARPHLKLIGTVRAAELDQMRDQREAFAQPEEAGNVIVFEWLYNDIDMFGLLPWSWPSQTIASQACQVIK
jgi:hypothetical protein